MGELTQGAKGCPHCRRSFVDRNPVGALPVATLLGGRYTVGEMISIDGEGILYRGVENKGGFRVTIKEYLPVTLSAERGDDMRLAPKPGSEVLFKTTRMDFADLYHALQRITPATGLEAVLDVLDENNTVYAIMENPGGKPLRQWLAEHGGKVKPAEACKMLQPVFSGVTAMHQVGLVHRGISPENIRVLENGHARLTGYATIGLRTAGSGLHEQLYAGYSAPEQYSSSEFGGRYTDEYSLAAVLYRMVCGQAPVPAEQRVVSDTNPRARSVDSSVPSYISDVLDYGLRLKPTDRIQTVPRLVNAISTQEGAQAFLQAEHAKEKERKPKKTINSTIVLLSALTILILSVTFLMIWNMLQNAAAHDRDLQPSPTPEESPVESVEVSYVPNFVGLTYSQVQNNRQYTSSYLFRVTEEYDDTVAEGVILSQEPAAGTVFEDGDIIQLVVSKGPKLVEMPSIIGFTQESAIKELQNRGLIPSCFMVVNDGSYASGCVVQCSAEAGTQLEVGTIITVYIAADRDVTATVTPTPTPEQSEEPTANPDDDEETPATTYPLPVPTESVGVTEGDEADTD
jgi:serine/threonine-protein kinase